MLGMNLKADYHFRANIPDKQEKDKSVSFWKRRITNPLIAQLKQGTSPEMLALSVAWGCMLGVFPILGTTTLLCGLAGMVLRLNHIAMQTVNWLIYPVQILLIIPFLQLGNLVFGIGQFPLSLSEITALFEADFWGSMRDMGWLAARGVLAWILVALPSVFIIRMVLIPVFNQLARSMPQKAATT